MKILFLFILALLIFSEAFPFPTDFGFRNYNTENGLSSNSIKCIIQDNDGFIWIGTSGGLNRFDGISFKLIPELKNDSVYKADHFITTLKESSDKKLWVGTIEGVFIYDQLTETLTQLTATTPNGISLAGNITNFAEDASHNMWIATNNTGLFRYSPNGTLKRFLAPQQEGKAALKSFLALCVDNENRVWASLMNSPQQLLYYDEYSDELVYYFNQNNLFPDNLNICNLLSDSQGRFWISTWNKGLFLLDTKTGNYKNFDSSGKVANKNRSLDYIHVIYEYNPNLLLIGTENGICIFNITKEQCSFIVRNESDRRSLSDNSVYTLFEDKEGGLWVGTYYGGVDYSSRNNGMFERYMHADYENSVSGNVISSFVEAPDGTIWVGSVDGGISCYNPLTKEFKSLPINGNNKGLSYHNIQSLFIDQNELWVGTYSGGLNVINLKNMTIRKFNKSNPEMDGMSSIYSIYKDIAGEIWIGTMSGINKYDKQAGNFPRMKNLTSTTLSIIQDSDGIMWFGTENEGLLSYNIGTGRWLQYINDPNNPESLPGNCVMSFCVDNLHRLWIGTNAGLCRWNPQKSNFTREKIVFPSNSICGIVSDRAVLWLTTHNGLIQYNTENQYYRLFTRHDGLQNDHFNEGACLKSSTDKIYIGTINGFNIFSPEIMTTNNYSPPVVFTELKIFNKKADVKNKEGKYVSVNHAEELSLSYNQKIISISFAALSYTAPANNRYLYKLDGFEQDWNATTEQHTATYTNLKPGEYTFMVKASNNDGIWNENGKKLHLIIKPPLLLSNGFIFIYCLLFCLFILLSILLFLKRTRLKHDYQIRQINADKEKELYSAKLNFFTLVAHEIRTPVSLMIGPLDNLLRTYDKINDQQIKKDLDIANKNGQRLMSLINQLLDFRKAEEGTFILNLDWHPISNIVNNVAYCFTPAIEQQGLKSKLILPDNEIIVLTDKEAMTKIISNLMSNAIKNADKEITVSCNADIESGIFWISVHNDGRFIPDIEKEKIFTPFYQTAGPQYDNSGTGIGLSLVKLVADTLRGEISVESSPTIGTTFRINFPIKLESKEHSLRSENQGEASEKTIDVKYNLNMTRHVAQKQTGKPLVLFVEDNEDMRNFVFSRLSEIYEVVCTSDGVEALDWLTNHDPSIIVADIIMPRLDGISLCRKIKEDLASSHIPVILLTAKVDIQSKIEGLKIGADAYIEKPFSIDHLMVQIDNLIQSRHKLLLSKFFDIPLFSLNDIQDNKDDNGFLKKVNKIIDENIDNPDFTIEVMAVGLSISRSSLFSKIKNIIGTTPNELIQLMRLKKAAELLVTTDCRINEIAYMVGFNSPSYFSKCFQRQFGISPKEFTEQNNKEISANHIEQI